MTKKYWTMKTKKDYIIPEICEYNIMSSAIICQSAIIAGGSDDDDYVVLIFSSHPLLPYLTNNFDFGP
jgi:hypothetical protein